MPLKQEINDDIDISKPRGCRVKNCIITMGGQLVGGTDPRVTLRLAESKKDSTLLLFLFTYF
jgi:hypothetical protein